ncbi:MAG: AI-2E family transporter [Candidatus Yanofskybacteria bacterium]|nr:AI-2E family transporter [Candidatus Yanofskybacteria bacterium]
MNEHQTIDIHTSAIFKVVFVLLGLVFLYLVRDVIVILFLAIIIASAVGPFANWLEEKKIPRLLGVLFLYLAFFGLVIFLLSLVVPFLASEIGQLTQALPKFVSSLSGALEKAQQTTSSRYFDFFSEIQNLLDSFSQLLQAYSQSAINLVVNIFGGVLSFVAIIIISFYLSVMRRGIIGFIGSILPEKYEDYVISLWKRAEYKVGRWLQGQLLMALSVGLIVFVGLSLFHVKYALLLGVLAMILEIVPVVGPVISAIPGVIFAFTQSPALGMWVVVFYVAVQQIESHIFAPLILGKTLGLNPVTVIIALLVGGKIAGILGIILAVPVAVIIVEILDDIAKHKESRKAVVVE